MERLFAWFARRGWEPFDFQRQAWDAYLAGRSGLVHAPTGVGKTYAVWGGPLLEWLRDHSAGEAAQYAPPLRVLWITPLRALANDTAEALREPIDALGLPWTIESRTGDTSAAVRARQRRVLPTALITTPESLSLLLSYPDSVERLRGVACAVVDEWHELLGTKRGVQTQLGLARLRRLSPGLRTWGLSATLGNLDEAMEVLMGLEPSPPGGGEGQGEGSSLRLHRDPQSPHPSRLRRGEGVSEDPHHLPGGPLPQKGEGVLIHGRMAKSFAVDTLRPTQIEHFPWAGHLGIKLLDRVLAALEAARSTLLFTNTRSQTEIWFQAILRARPDWIGEVAVHHGSLDHDLRRRVEDLLRAGKLRCVVCTSSLDLGVDFSPVDQVLQVGSPKGIARFMQRAGRSGHQPGATSRILGVPAHALELVEFAAAREAAQRREIESRQPPDRPLDVLVQHLVTIALGSGFAQRELFDEVRTTHAFRDLSEQEWRWALDFVTRGGEALHAYPQYSRVVERDGRFVVESRLVERLHRMSIGTITSDASVRVAFQSGRVLGTIEESFIGRLRKGDRFVFAGRVLEFVRMRNLVATVREATGKRGTVPRWMGGKSPLSTELAHAVRRKFDEACEGLWLDEEMRSVRPILELQSAWSVLPRSDELLIESLHTRDGHHLFVFPFEGRAVHDGVAALLAYRLTRREPRSILTTVNDYGIELLNGKPWRLREGDWRELLSTERLVEDLLACLNATGLARGRFRDIARVAGLIFSGYPGQPRSTRYLQASSELFFDVFLQFDPDNLLLDQARREVLERELEVQRLRRTLERLATMALRLIEPARLTPLSLPLWAESLRSQMVSSEKWSERVRRMVEQLEAAAEKERRNGESKRQKPKGVLAGG